MIIKYHKFGSNCNSIVWLPSPGVVLTSLLWELTSSAFWDGMLIARVDESFVLCVARNIHLWVIRWPWEQVWTAQQMFSIKLLSIDHCSCLKSMVIAGSSLSQTGVICWYEGQHGEMDMTGGVNQNVSPHWTAADISPCGHTTQHNTTQHWTCQKLTTSSTFSCGIFSGTIDLSSINACLVSQR